MSACRPEELLIATLADELAGLSHIAVGAASPIPGAAALLARAQAKQAGKGTPLRLSILGSAAHNPFTDGGRELFDCAAQGRIDAFFLGGGQVDGEANINLVGVGDYPRTTARFPGSFGSAYLYFLVPKVILFVREHSPRNLVERVDFISAPGRSEPGTYRPGGPRLLVTGRAVFNFGADGFSLRSVHPGESAESVRDATGFAFRQPAEVPLTVTPAPATLALLREEIAPQVAWVYPRFAADVFSISPAPAPVVGAGNA